MKIQILGTGCCNCNKLEDNVKSALKKLGIEAEIVKIKDIQTIIEMGVMSTPALAIDGVVKSVGKTLSTDEITKLIGVKK